MTQPAKKSVLQQAMSASKPKLRSVKATPQEAEAEAAGRALLMEIDDSLHQERMAAIWQYGKGYIISAVIALFAVVIGWQGYSYYKDQQAAEYASQWQSIITAMGQGESLEQIFTAKQPEFSALKQAQASGYRVLAHFATARALTEQQKFTEAAASYNAVSADTSIPPVLRDLAQFNAALVLVGVDNAKAQSQFSQLAQGSSAYKPMALEMLAQLAETEQKFGDAITFYERVLAMEAEIPPTLTERVRERLSNLRAITGLGNL